MADSPPNLPYRDDPSCRDAYAEVIQVIYRSPGVVRIEFSVTRWTHEDPVQVDCISPVARVVVPLDGAKLLLKQLENAIETLEKGLASAPFHPAAVTRQ